ncbi:hypothetical protein BV22DRAFT_979774, partial [Leucogyrophana mollusca]
VADGLSRQWEGVPRNQGTLDGSEWTVSEDWETRTGLINDVLHVGIEGDTARNLKERFVKEPLFLEVVDALLNMDQERSIRERARARHRASQYMVEDGKLWRLTGGTAERARGRVECVTQEEATVLAAQQHAKGGHWGRDAIKIALTDRIHSPKLDASILTAI